MGFEFKVIQHGVKYHLGADIVKCPECDEVVDTTRRHLIPIPESLESPEKTVGLMFVCESCGCVFEGRKPKKSK